jgi:cell division transport system permease protein
MSRLKLLFSEAMQSTRASMSTTVAATLTVLAAMFVLGCALALGTLLRSYGDHVKKQLVVKVYFCGDVSLPDSRCVKRGRATDHEINVVRAKLEGNPKVKSVEFVSKAEALKRMKKERPDIVRNIVSNPLPASEEVTPVKGEFTQQIADWVDRAKFAGVDRASYGKETTKKILHYANVFNILFAIALVILVAASMLLVVNTIRLSIFSRRREIEVMKLVGASNWFVRGPFMIEGLITGFLGSLAAIILLLVAKQFALPSFDFLKAPGAHAIAFELNALLLLGFGLLIGVVGSTVTLRRFLRV